MALPRLQRERHALAMPLRDDLLSGNFPVALEITPPRHALPHVLERRARLIEPYATAVNVIQRSDRQSSLHASVALHSRSIEPVWHLTVRGRRRDDVIRDLHFAQVHRVHQLLCILGDSSDANDAPDQLKVRDAIALARDILPGALIGATFNQHVDDLNAAKKNVLPKLGAGATYIQTQPVFSVEAFRKAIAPIRDAAPDVRIVPMVMPLLTALAAQRIGERLGIEVPQAMVRRIRSGPGEAWRAFAETVLRLREDRLADGIAVMTFETDPGPEIAARIVDALRQAGIRPRRA